MRLHIGGEQGGVDTFLMVDFQRLDEIRVQNG